MRLLTLLVSVIVLFVVAGPVLVFGVPAKAQTQQQIDWCVNRGNIFTPDLTISGCTALTQSGQMTQQNLAKAYSNRGIAYFRKGQPDRAIQDYDQAIRLDPNFAFAFNNRGIAYFRKGQPDRAIQDFDQAIRLDPNYAEAFNYRGDAYDKKGQPDRAIADYDQAIRLKPNYAEAFSNRGTTYDGKGQYDRAIQDYDQAIRLNSNDAIAFYNRGNAYANKGQYDRAIQDYDQAIRLNSNDASAFYKRGLAKRAKGDSAGGDADLAKAKQLNPSIGSAAPQERQPVSQAGRPLAFKVTRAVYTKKTQSFITSFAIPMDLAKNPPSLTGKPKEVYTETEPGASKSFLIVELIISGVSQALEIKKGEFVQIIDGKGTAHEALGSASGSRPDGDKNANTWFPFNSMTLSAKNANQKLIFIIPDDAAELATIRFQDKQYPLLVPQPK